RPVRLSLNAPERPGHRRASLDLMHPVPGAVHAAPLAALWCPFNSRRFHGTSRTPHPTARLSTRRITPPMRAPRTQNRTYATRTHPRTRTALLALLTLLGGLLTVATTASPAAAAPNFKAPYGCGQQWTYSHHSAE